MLNDMFGVGSCLFTDIVSLHCQLSPVSLQTASCISVRHFFLTILTDIQNAKVRRSAAVK